MKMANKYALEKSESMGGKAFLDGDLICECPFNKESESDLYNAWMFGYKCEEKFWYGEKHA